MKHPSLGDDLSQVPDYPDMIVIPFKLPWRYPAQQAGVTARPIQDWLPVEGLSGASAAGQSADIRPPDRTVRSAPPVRASGHAPPEVSLIVAGVRGQPALVVSGFSDGALTLYRRGNDQMPPQPLASFAADLDGSFYDAAGTFVGWLHGDEALLHPDWLRMLDVAGGRPGQDRPPAPLIQVQEDEEEERRGHLPGEHLPGQPTIHNPFPSQPLTPEQMERHEGAPVPLLLPPVAGRPARAAGPQSGSGNAVLELIMPGGKLIGFREKGAGKNTITVSRQELSEIVAKLMAMKPGKVDNPTYREGQWYRLPDGSEFGLRESKEHGLTLDTPKPGRGNIKVHQK